MANGTLRISESAPLPDSHVFPRQHDKFLIMDGLRGVAAAFVFTRHTSALWSVTFFQSYLAVDLFFVLSGFVIGNAYAEKLLQGRLSILEFMKIRLVRLYPVYLLATFVSLVAAVCEHSSTGAPANIKQLSESFLLTLLFLPSHYGHGNMFFPLNGPFWSLFYELILNFALAVLLAKKALPLMGFLIVAFAAEIIWASLRFNGLDTGFSWDRGSIATAISRAGFGIFCGYLLCRFGTSRYRRLGIWFGTSFGALPLIAGAAAILAWPSLGSIDWLFDSLAVLVAFPAIVLLASKIPTPHLLRLPFALLGEISYPMYALHAPIGALVFLAVRPILGESRSVYGIALMLGVSLASLAVSRVFDKPVRDALTRQFIGGRIGTSAPAKA
jgi:peptidoglycan/LPS O-acetylase OafA/YrhL